MARPHSTALLVRSGERTLLVRHGGRGLFPHAWTLPATNVRDESQYGAGADFLLARFGLVGPEPRHIGALATPSHIAADRGPTAVFAVETDREPVAGAEWADHGWFALEEMGGLLMLREGREAIASLLSRAEEPAAR